MVDLLLFEDETLSGREVILSDKPVIFGRAEDVDVRIDEQSVSRQHAQIIRIGTAYQLKDLGSRNGTFVNEIRLVGTHPLSNGDRIRFGATVVLVVALKPDAAAQTVIAGETTPPDVSATQIKPPPRRVPAEKPEAPKKVRQAARLRIHLPDATSTVSLLTGEKISVGRLETNDIVINVQNVSRQHFHLVRDADEYTLVVEPEASNPVYVNGAAIAESQRLANGDTLTIGLPTEKLFLSMDYIAASVAEVKEPSEDIYATRVSRETPVTTDSPRIRTTFIGEIIESAPIIPPQLVITAYQHEPLLYPLEQDHIRIGRHPDNDIVLEQRFVSRHHAEIEKRGTDFYIVPSPAVGNPLVMNGLPVMEALRLEDKATLRIHGVDPGEMVTLVYLSPEDEARKAREKVIQFDESKAMSIGRDPDNDIVLEAPTISRIHAQVERIGQRYRVRDLQSSNGTFVNGSAITGDTWLQTGDTIHIGPFRLKVGEDSFSQHNESEGGIRIEAFELNKWVRKDLNILQNISLAFQPREFIVVVGQSGGGKSTLVDAIAGYRPATHGKVMVNDSIDVYKNFDAIRNTIGFVPQKDIIHMELTVFQALDYAAQLRMPADTTKTERHSRIAEVMEELDLAHRRDTQISELSGGQQKRVSIGVELLTKPGLFFLDEPTSGLDPGMETDLMQLMRRLADQGRTIVLITHATKNVMLADRVVFLARGGYLAWFGPPEEALQYFDQYRSDRDRRAKPMEFDDIYKLLDKAENGTPDDWAKRFLAHGAYKKYISVPLKDHTPTPMPLDKPVVQGKTSTRRVSTLRQFRILSGRNIKILTRDRATLGLMLFSAPLMACLDFILAFGVGRNPFGFNGGDFNDIIVTLIVLTNTSILVGGLTMMRELVKEREIYKRERLVNLKLSAYITSKLFFAFVLALYQSFFFTLVRHLAFDMPGGFLEVIFFFITIFFMVMAGMIMGLLTSALAPNSNAAALILVMFILPQIVLSGALVPLPNFASAPASSRWTFQAVIGISGAGSDVARDACWTDLTKDEQDALSLDEKEDQCACMGVNALRQDSCNFPGLGQFYVDAIDTPAPIEPIEPSPEPAGPVYPEAPEAPADLGNPEAIQTYLAELETYNDEATALRESFEAELSAYRDAQNGHKEAIEVYLDEYTEYETDRATAVGSAEATIRRFYEDYGWTFLDKTDRTVYLGALMKTWLAQVIIITLLFVATVFVQKSRDIA